MRAMFLATIVASLAQMALADDWWVVVSYVDHPPMEWDDAVLVRGNTLEAQLAPCGLTVFWDFAAKFDGFDTNGRGSVFVLSTPDVLTRANALALLDKALPCVSDAYVKQALYFGE